MDNDRRSWTTTKVQSVLLLHLILFLLHAQVVFINLFNAYFLLLLQLWTTQSFLVIRRMHLFIVLVLITYLHVDWWPAYSECWTLCYLKPINRSHVLPVLCCLQGHPESDKVYERHINQVLRSQDLKFKNTEHLPCIYQTTYKGHKILLLRQVNYLVLITNDESTAKESYKIVGNKL